jgi:hypothetical protein
MNVAMVCMRMISANGGVGRKLCLSQIYQIGLVQEVDLVVLLMVEEVEEGVESVVRKEMKRVLIWS